MSEDWEARRRAARALAIEAGFSARDADLIVRLARPAARLQATPRAAAGVGASKLGGLPDPPHGSEWPTGEWGPMLFYGRLHIADVAFLRGVDDWQPEEGTLSFT